MYKALTIYEKIKVLDLQTKKLTIKEVMLLKNRVEKPFLIFF